MQKVLTSEKTVYKDILPGSLLVLSAILYNKTGIFTNRIFFIYSSLILIILLIYLEIKYLPDKLTHTKKMLRIFFLQNKIIWYGAVILTALSHQNKYDSVLLAAATNIILLLIMLADKCEKSYLIQVAAYLVAGSTVSYLLLR